MKSIQNEKAAASADLALKRVGLADKEVKVYLALIELGPSPVRSIAARSGINRGTTYEVLKSLIDLGLVSYFHKVRHQYFAAEHPSKLQALLASRSRELSQAQRELQEIIPILAGRTSVDTGRPRVRFFEGASGIRTMLEDVLSIMATEPNKEYRVYSFADVREHLYTGFRDFAERRVKLGIRVRVIALGPGGKLWGLDERRWLPGDEHDLTYQIIYAGKFAMISLDDRDQPIGALVEDQRVAKTQQLIFDRLWATLSDKNS